MGGAPTITSEVIAAVRAFGDAVTMTPQRILRSNALFTAAGALGLLATRAWTPPLFGLGGPALLDALAVALLPYAAVVMAIARRRVIDRKTMLVFAVADTAWVIGSAIIISRFWTGLAPLGRALIMVQAVAVGVFAVIQFRAAGQAASATTSARAALF
jgi:hypothetical protein